MTYQEEDLTGKVAVITGTSAGIGAALAHGLHERGVKLALASRRGTDLGLPGVVSHACDVREAGQVKDLVDVAVTQFGRLDILVANAGVGHYASFLDTPEEHITEMLATNVTGTINLLRAGLPHMIEAGRGGDVITVASEAGRRGFPGEAVYCASKFAQVGLTRALDGEMREHGIRCTNICPGGVFTEFAMSDGRGRTPDSPAVQSMMRADDVADLIVYTLTRPRNFRMLEVALRPMSEPSWG
jgi:meso-butanediol dehydrogenase/(S,S)-butanediol dehydrogenase/diacetyl reductase